MRSHGPSPVLNRGGYLNHLDHLHHCLDIWSSDCRFVSFTIILCIWSTDYLLFLQMILDTCHEDLGDFHYAGPNNRKNRSHNNAVRGNANPAASSWSLRLCKLLTSTRRRIFPEVRLSSMLVDGSKPCSQVSRTCYRLITSPFHRARDFIAMLHDTSPTPVYTWYVMVHEYKNEICIAMQYPRIF